MSDLENLCFKIFSLTFSSITEVQLDDFELKESHVIDATHSKNINNGAGPTTSLAWGDSKKQQKISANYK